MKATIMIPAYNVEKFLAESIESALNQKYRGKYEILIVNDGSTDNTGEIIEFYQRKNPHKVRVIFQENKRQGITRNVLLEDSRGEILLGLDADDKLHPNALEKVVSYFDKNPRVGFVYTDQNEIDEKNKFIRSRRRYECDQFFDDIIYYCHFCGHLRSFRKRDIDGFRFDPKFRVAGDWDFLLNIFPYIKKGHIPEVLYDYRINENGISISFRNLVIETSINILRKYLSERKVYGDKDFKIVPAKLEDNIAYYEHVVDGKETMKPRVRSALIRYLKGK